jgi:hypothetical protein
MSTPSRVSWTAVAPLFNFHCSSNEPIELGQGLTIRLWRGEIHSQGPPPDFMNVMFSQTGSASPWVQFRWVLWYTWEELQGPGAVGVASAMPVFDRAVEALHLLHDEMVAFPFLIAGVGDPPQYGMGMSRITYPDPPAWARAINHPYNFQRTESEALSELLVFLTTLVAREPENAAALSLSRLALAHCRATDADKIIDASIALEAILLRGAEGELSYRQAVRGAHLLAGPPEIRRRNFVLLKRAYDRRSKIVHGGRDPGSPGAEEVMAITRRIVRQFVDTLRNETHQNLIARLDAAAVTGAGLTTE